MSKLLIYLKISIYLTTPIFLLDLPSRALTTKPRSIEPKTPTRDVTKTAQFYFPNYVSQKQKNANSISANESINRSLKIPPANKPNRTENTLPKQVSFMDDKSMNSTHVRRTQFASGQASLPEANPLSNGLSLTAKNLDMYNTLAMTSELSAPSGEEDRVASWVKERHHWTSELCEDIPEIAESIMSLPTAEHDGSTSTTLSVHGNR